MNDLIFSCTDALAQAETPVCGTNYGERVTRIILSKTLVAAAGNVPTAEEFDIAYNAGTTALFKVVSGHRVFLGETEIEWHNKEWYDKQYRIEGNIRLIDEQISRACEILTRYKNLYAYYITDRSYCFGGYYVDPDFSLILFDGKGQPVAVRFHLDFIGNGIDYSNYDADYFTLPDVLAGRAILTESGFKLLTEDGKTLVTE